jgi:hypothetical protein
VRQSFDVGSRGLFKGGIEANREHVRIVAGPFSGSHRVKGNVEWGGSAVCARIGVGVHLAYQQRELCFGAVWCMFKCSI